MASTARIAWPVPTAMPAARRARVKCRMFSASRPWVGADIGEVISGPKPLRGIRRRCRRRGLAGSRGMSRARLQAGLDLIEDPPCLRALETRDIVLVFQKRAKRIGDEFRRQRQRIESGKGPRPEIGRAHV